MKRLIAAALISAATSLAATAQSNSPAPEGYRDRAVRMFADRNYTGCMDQMQYLRQQCGDDPSLLADADYYMALASARLRRADAEGLMKFFLWKYPADPRRWEVLLTLAERRLDAANYPGALAAADRVDPQRLSLAQAARWKYVRGIASLELGNLALAGEMLSAVTQSGPLAPAARFYLGYIAYTQGDFNRAKELLSKTDTSVSPGKDAPFYLAQIAFAERDFQRALTLSQRLAADPSTEGRFKAEALRIAGESNYNLGNDSQAVDYLNRYIAATDNPAPSARYILGLDAYRAGDYRRAIDLLTPVTKTNGAMAQSAYLTIGESLMAQRDWSAAMIALKQAFDMDFDRQIKETALYNYAVAKTEGGRIPFGSTVATFEEFLRLFPDSPHADRIRRHIATGYITDNNLPAALASLRAVRRPDDETHRTTQTVLYLLGTREEAAGNHTQAIDYLRQARALKKYSPQTAAEAQLWEAEAQFNAGNYDEAIACYRAVADSRLLAAENRSKALYGYGYAAFNAKNYPLATETFSKFVDSYPQVSPQMIADAHNRIADSHFMERDYALAAQSYAKAIATWPDGSDYPLFQQAFVKGLSGDGRAKIDGLTTLIRRFPESPLVPDAMFQLAMAQEQAGQTERAIETYAQLAARHGSTPQGRDAQLNMAVAYVNNGDNAKAIETYKALISRAPSSSQAATATEGLRELMLDNGQIDAFTSFMASVPGLTVTDEAADRLEQSAFESAERHYLSTGTTGRIQEYIDRFPNGSNLPAALAYAMDANASAGNDARAEALAAQLVERFPDNEAAPRALLVMAQRQMLLGKGEEALANFDRLRASSPSPELTNAAIEGIVNASLQLSLTDRALEAADALLASSTPTAAQKTAAAFGRGQALALSGNPDAAIETWTAIASDLDDPVAAKAAFSIAQQQFNKGDLDAAQQSAEALVDSSTPHIYWLARAFILMSDIHHARGNDFEAEQYLRSLRENYPGNEADIINLIDSRLNSLQAK